jgi:sec-independent protein translocase protein TatA
MGRIGLTELLILLVIALVVFGGGKIADVGKGIGDAVKNFKKGMKEDDDANAPKLNESAAKAEAPAPPVITVVDDKTAAEATKAEPAAEESVAAEATQTAAAAEEPAKAAPGEEKPAA